MSATVTSMLEPDTTAIRLHLERLFSRARSEYPDGLCEIAWSGHDYQVTSGQMFPLTATGLDHAANHAAKVNRLGRNVYVGVNPRKPTANYGRRASAADVEIAFFHFADADKLEQAERIKRDNPLPYTFAVTTGRTPVPRPQPYWELEEPTRNMPAWTAQQAAIATFFGTDRVINPDRIMRLAGSVNYPKPDKMAKGYAVEVVTIRTEYDDDREPVSAEAVAASFQARAVPTTTSSSPAGAVDGLDLDDGATTVASLIAAIQAGHEWHNNVVRLVGHLIGRGLPDAVIMAMADSLTLPGWTVDATRAEMQKAIQGGRLKWNMPNPEESVDEFASAAPVALEAAPLDIISPIPERPWIIRNFALRGRVTVLVAPGGVGKTTLLSDLAVAYAAKHPQWAGYKVTAGSGKIWIYNAEDEIDELRRRIFAAAVNRNVALSTIQPRLYLNSGADRPLVVAKVNQQTRAIVGAPDVDAIIEQIKANNIDIIIIDPFAETHEANENDNVQMRKAAAMFREIAQRANCAVVLVHHTSKIYGDDNIDAKAGDMDAGRGASSVSGVARLMFTLLNMSKKMAATLGIPEDQQHLYVRLDEAKSNLSLITKATRWFKRASVNINPKTVDLDDADTVGVLEHVSLQVAADHAKQQQDDERKRLLDGVVDAVGIGGSLGMSDLVDQIRYAGVDPSSESNVRRRLAEVIGTPHAPTTHSTAEGQVRVWHAKSGPSKTAPIVVRCVLVEG